MADGVVDRQIQYYSDRIDKKKKRAITGSIDSACGYIDAIQGEQHNIQGKGTCGSSLWYGTWLMIYEVDRQWHYG